MLRIANGYERIAEHAEDRLQSDAARGSAALNGQCTDRKAAPQAAFR